MGDEKDIILFDENQDATNYCIVGNKRMGKTTLLKNLIRILVKKDIALICYDRLNQFRDILPCYSYTADVPDGTNRQFCITMDSIENFVAMVELYREEEMEEGRKLVVIIDELDTFYGQWGPLTSDPDCRLRLTAWVDYSRHIGIEVWGSVRRPQKIWQHYLEQAERIFLFKTTGTLARKKLSDVVDSPRMLHIVGHLKPFTYLVYPDETDDIERGLGDFELDLDY